MLNCGGGGLNGRQLAVETLNFREGRAEVEEWGWGKRKQRVPEQHCTADQGQAKGWQVGPHSARGR